MTEYGRGQGSEPWHPEDPLYGDQGWTGHQTQQGQAPYGGDPQQQYPQEQQYQQPYPQQPQQPQYVQQHPQHQQHPQYVQQQHQGYAPQQQPVYDNQGWDTAQGQYVGVVQGDPYAGADPYASQPVPVYPGAEAPDLYTTEEAYPPPQPPGRRHLVPEQAEDVDEEPEESFLAGGGGRGDDDGDEPGTGRRSGRSKGGKPKKRSGMACLIAAAVIIGVVGGGGYYGYTYLKAKFGAPEDFAGEGTDEVVEVEIPKGSGLLQMGAILKKAGVVASAQAFADAADKAQKAPGGKAIQAGVYPLKKRMSAAAAVAVMSDPSKLHMVMVTEGMRNVDVYKAIDKSLGQQEGTTHEVAKREFKNLGLPAWANSNPKIMDPLEGFLFPARYDLSKESTPDSVLKQMVKKANENYAAIGIEGKAKELGLDNPLQVVTVASLINAEGMNHDDFKKMSEVIYNRLKKTNDVTNQKLEFDSTINYLKGTSNINVSRTETRTLDHAYNTYFYKGLPPGPIGNPGDDALNATLNPDKGGWMFFVSVDGNKTTFTKTFDEHEKLVAEFNERQKQKNGG
ncbi:endolytic transglycosylase MltG [Streptomyces sp. NPDC057011]|uniref:endolytic transglycosylase MltG n=1 Tax=unclassified Streptomyces TaxID=2593676 RepID=UPI003641B2E9